VRNNLRSVQSPRKARERSRPGGIESICGLSVATVKEVSVHVVGGPDRGMTESLGDDIGVLSGGDQERRIERI